MATRKTTKRATKRATKKKVPVNQLSAVEMRNMSSEFVRDISYADGDLTIEFRNGAVYRYMNVDSETVQDFLAADSFGRFFNETIRHYKYERLDQ